MIIAALTNTNWPVAMGIDHVLKVLQVGVGPTHEVAGCIGIVKGEMQSLDVSEEPISQAGLDPTRIAECHITSQPKTDRRDRTCKGDQQRPHEQRAALLNPTIDAELYKQRHCYPTKRPPKGNHLTVEDKAPFLLDGGPEQLPPGPRRVRIIGLASENRKIFVLDFFCETQLDQLQWSTNQPTGRRLGPRVISSQTSTCFSARASAGFVEQLDETLPCRVNFVRWPDLQRLDQGFLGVDGKGIDFDRPTRPLHGLF